MIRRESANAAWATGELAVAFLHPRRRCTVSAIDLKERS